MSNLHASLIICRTPATKAALFASPSKMPLNIVIYLFQQVEVLDFAGPYEVFTTANRVALRDGQNGFCPFNVCTVAKSTALITARAGLQVIPGYSIKATPHADVLLIPGGIVDAEMADGDVIEWIADCAKSSRIIASICTGAFLLAKAGLLNGRSATTHWQDVAALRLQFPDLLVREEVQWVDEGCIVTSGGIAAGIDMSLHLVSRLAGIELARATAKQLGVQYHEP